MSSEKLLQPVHTEVPKFYIEITLKGQGKNRIKTVDLEEGLPTVEQARLRMQYELQSARKAGFALVMS